MKTSSVPYLGRYMAPLPLAFRLIDGLLLTLVLYAICLIYYQDGPVPADAIFFQHGYIIVALITCALYYAASPYTRIFRVELLSNRGGVLESMGRVTLNWLIAIAGLIFIGFLTKTTSVFSRSVTLVWFCITPAVLVPWRMALAHDPSWSRRLTQDIDTVVVGGKEDCLKFINTLQSIHGIRLRVKGYYLSRHQQEGEEPLSSAAGQEDGHPPCLGGLPQVILDAKNGAFQLVYICMPLREQKVAYVLVEALADSTVSVYYVIPESPFLNLMQPTVHYIGERHALSIFDTPSLGCCPQRIKRAEDLILGSLILLLIAVPMLVIALAIKLDSPGPVLFRQDRYGIGGKKFKIYKFRTMRTLENTRMRQARKNDPRVTRLGAFLRRTSLDELPQFINVLKGDMSIVGPRPHAVVQNEQYRRLISGYMLRHKVKPGITGLAQINGCRGPTETPDKMEMRIRYDLEYIRNWTLGLDLRIIIATIFKGFTGKNAF